MLTHSTTLILFNNPHYKVALTPSVIEYNTSVGGVDHSEKTCRQIDRAWKSY